MMKALLPSPASGSILLSALLLIGGGDARGQGSFSTVTFGTVNFNNRVVSEGINAPVYDFVMGGTMLSGTNYLAQLYAGPVGTPEANLVATGVIVDFRTNGAAGFINVGADGSRSIASVAPGEWAVVQIRAWTAATGATYEDAMISGSPDSRVGKSNVLNVQTKSSVLDIPINMAGLQSFALTAVPEPDVVWLGSLGLAFLALRFRFTEESQENNDKSSQGKALPKQ